MIKPLVIKADSLYCGVIAMFDCPLVNCVFVMGLLIDDSLTIFAIYIYVYPVYKYRSMLGNYKLYVYLPKCIINLIFV